MFLEAALSTLSLLKKHQDDLGRGMPQLGADGRPASQRESPEAVAAKRMVISGQVPKTEPFPHIFLIVSVG